MVRRITVTELVIALVVRTRRPGDVLLWSTFGLIAVMYAIPYLPQMSVFGFVPLPVPLLLTVTGITG